METTEPNKTDLELERIENQLELLVMCLNNLYMVISRFADNSNLNAMVEKLNDVNKNMQEITDAIWMK